MEDFDGFFIITVSVNSFAFDVVVILLFDDVSFPRNNDELFNLGFFIILSSSFINSLLSFNIILISLEIDIFFFFLFSFFFL